MKLVAAVVWCAFAASPAWAHPHVYADSRVEISFDSGKITAIRNIWRFDPAFSAFATTGLDTDNDGKLTTSELEPLAKINMESLAEFAFFTRMIIGETQVPFGSPIDYSDSMDDDRLTLSFTLPLKIPTAPSRDLLLGISDPTYFVALEFDRAEPIAVPGAPAGCVAQLHPPKEVDDKTLALLALIPQDQKELPPDLAAAAISLGNNISVTCMEQ